MISGLRAALSAPALLLLSVSFSSPSFAQSTPAEATDIDTARRTGGAPVAVIPVAPAAAPAETKIVTPRARAASGSRPYDAMIASHAASNGVPAELVHRVVLRESRYRAGAMGRGGTTGLMQIKLATARSMGYTGSAAGLLDPDTNLAYGVRYLAGAYRAANGHHGRAIGYYASGYRGAARPARAYARATPTEITSSLTADATTGQVLVQEPTVRRKRR